MLLTTCSKHVVSVQVMIVFGFVQSQSAADCMFCRKTCTHVVSSFIHPLAFLLYLVDVLVLYNSYVFSAVVTCEINMLQNNFYKSSRTF